MSYFFDCVMRGDVESTLGCLRNGMNIDAVGPDDVTALMFVLGCNEKYMQHKTQVHDLLEKYHQIADLLLENGCDIDFVGPHECTMLIAATRRDWDVFERLVERGAKLDYRVRERLEHNSTSDERWISDDLRLVSRLRLERFYNSLSESPTRKV